jgi:glycosyltransferase involved in cell wall biosynthesis
MNDAPVKTIAVVAGFAESLINFRGPLLRALTERGHRVVGCAPPASDATVKALAAMGVAFRSVPLERSGLRPDRDLRALRHLAAIFRELSPDIVLSYTAKAVIYGSLAARIAGVPQRFAMITGLGYAFGSATGASARIASQAARLLYWLSLRGVDRVFFQNPDDRAEFERLGIVRPTGHSALINGSGIDLEAFAAVPSPAGAVSFLLIARLLAEKGIREYVEAARLLRRKHPAAAFRLVGWVDEGNPGGLTEEEVQGWEREGIIEYLGRLDDVRPAIAAASVYVLPSYYREGTPRTVLEAMAMGRPIITTDSPGCRETVQEGVNGYLVPPRDSAALADAMMRFIIKPDSIEAMGRESRRIAVDRYDVHKVNAVILEVIGLAG